MVSLLLLLTLPVIVVGGSSPCCQDGQLYSTEIEHCVDVNDFEKSFRSSNSSSSTDSADLLTVLASPLQFKCPEGYRMFNYTTSVNVSGTLIEPIFNSSVDESYYCSHRSDNNLVVFFCYPLVEVKKCCQPGFVINGQSLGECVRREGQFPFQSVIRPRNAPYDIVYSASNESHMSLQCKSDYNLFHPFPVYADNRFEILPPGRLYVPAGHYAMFRDIPEEYCVDLITNAGGNTSMTAAMCLPEGMNNVRWLLYEVYPYLHYQSAFFLVVCLVIYLSYPQLRNTMHGFTMTNFMFCMLVVQVEYGVIYHLPYVPHTWCFAKVKTLGFFRIASSAWITVMGFDVWMKIRCGERLKLKIQMITRGVYYSIYAWGLAAIFLIAIQIHIYIRYQGKRSEICWFGDSVISRLTWYPNVILVAGNLIFFIPSALEVYRSQSFLSRTEADMTKFEARRIKAIFRLFILEEFYIIPRLIHWVVDADIVSPYLLMLSISFYVSLGPCVFAVFILKKDVLNLLKKTLMCKRRRIRRFWQSKAYSLEEATSTSNSVSSARTASTSSYKCKGVDNRNFQHE